MSVFLVHANVVVQFKIQISEHANIQLAEQQLAIKVLTDYFPQLIIIHLMKHINM